MKATAVLAVLALSASAAAQEHRELRVAYDDVDFSIPSKLKYRAQFEAEDFKFDFNAVAPPATPPPGGSAVALSVDSLPSIAGEGVGMVQLKLGACGINLPHVHPRATELLYAVNAEDEGVLTAFAEENTGRVIEATLKAGQATFFPKGLVHFQYNRSCKEVLLIAALSSDDFGTQTITTQAIQNLPDEGLAASLGITEDALAILREGFQPNPALGSAECRARCGLDA